MKLIDERLATKHDIKVLRHDLELLKRDLTIRLGTIVTVVAGFFSTDAFLEISLPL